MGEGVLLRHKWICITAILILVYITLRSINALTAIEEEVAGGKVMDDGVLLLLIPVGLSRGRVSSILVGSVSPTGLA